ncbi:unnamed protein product [Orchesella dallaii]|uniref:MYND-type domain-containing protein n=1 Tax=Orchesella dallaii TaxID=48710 RepID=A0ABP1RD02_9HEXA
MANFAEPKGILELKPYLDNPERQALIVTHRRNLRSLRENLHHLQFGFISTSARPKFKQSVPKHKLNMKPITLKEMSPTKDHIYKDRAIELIIIEDPNLFLPSIHLVVEDKNGDPARLCIYNVERTAKKIVGKLEFGCKIGILNPYLRISLDGSHGLRVDDPKCIVYQGRKKDMCRFCGEENAGTLCCLCEKAKYCSEECDEYDHKVMGHGLICDEDGEWFRNFKGYCKRILIIILVLVIIYYFA